MQLGSNKAVPERKRPWLGLPNRFVLMMVFGPLASCLLVCSMAESQGVDQGVNPFVLLQNPSNAEITTINFDSEITDVVAGGSGRYLIVKMRDSDELTTVDVQSRKIVASIRLGTPIFNMTGGKDVLFVYRPTKRLLQRFRLPDLKMELNVTCQVPEPIVEIAMGCDTNSPLMVYSHHNSGTAHAIDTGTMQVVNTVRVRPWHDFSQQLVASANAELFVFGTQLLVQEGTAYKVRRQSPSEPSRFFPNGNGTLAYSNKGWVDNRASPQATFDTQRLIIPSVQPGYYLSMPYRKPHRPIGLFAEGQQRPLFVLTSLPFYFLEGLSETRIARHKRLWLIPSQKSLVHIPRSLTSVKIHALDIEQKLQDKAMDYLYVANPPRHPAIAGVLFEHQLDVRSSSGEVRYKLKSGPSEMAIDATGKLTWRTPKFAKHGLQNVELTISDSSGQVITHPLYIQIRKRPPPVLPVAVEANRAFVRHLYREWTDKDGQKIRARFIRVFAGIAYLESPEGRHMMAPLAWLDDDGQRYIQKAIELPEQGGSGNADKATPQANSDEQLDEKQ